MELYYLVPIGALLLLVIDPSVSTVTISTSSDTAVTDKIYSLTCTATISDIKWMNGSMTLTTDASTKIIVGTVTDNGDGMYSSILTFDRLQVAHGGIYQCVAGAEDDSKVVNVQIQSPLGPLQFTSDLSNPPFYSGTEMIFSCKFTYDKILTDPHITLFMEWEKDGVIITDDDRVDLFTEAMHIQGTPDAYYAELAYEYITLSDVGAYSCMLYSNGTTNTQYVINHVSMSAEYTVAIEVPIPIVNVTAESPRVPAHTDYNTALLTCSDILPLSSFNDEIAFDRVYTWYMDGVDVTGMATGPFDADEKESYGRLQIDVATTPGEAVFNCSVSISVPGDPIISANGSTSVEILSPTLPNVPTNVYSTDITYNSVTIYWTVPLLAYTPEQYSIYYGTSQSSLTKYNITVDGLVNYTVMDNEYTITVADLLFNTMYYYNVMATNTEGSMSTSISNFTTLNIEVPSGSPRNFSSVALSSVIALLQWRSIQESSRNAAIISYSIYCNSSQPIETIDAISSIESDEESVYSVNVTELLPYTMYLCIVYGNNSGGAGPNTTATVWTLQDKPGTPPTNVVINEFSSSSVIISWSKPSVPNGVVTEYTVFIDLLNGTTQFKTIDSTYEEYTLNDLSPYQLVQVGVSASTVVGEGPRSSPVQGRSSEAVSDAIPQVSYNAISSSVLRILFNAPSILVTHGVVLYYSIAITEYDSGIVVSNKQVLGNQSVIEVEFDGLRGEVPYNITLFAVNSAGNGDISSYTLFTEEGAPPSPSNIIINRLNGTHMNVTWDPIPLARSKGFILFYRVSYSRAVSIRKRQSGTESVAGNQTHAIIRNLDPSSQYSVTVNAETSAGHGESSEVIVVARPAAATSVGFLTTTNIVIIGSVGVALFILVIIVVIVAVGCSRRQKDSVDLPKELKAISEGINIIETGPSLAYGQLPHTPEPDQDPFMKSHITAQNPTYNYSSTYSKPYDHNPNYKPYEHTYESIDNIIASRGAGFQSYDTPKPQLPTPRPSVSDGSQNSIS